MKKKNAIIINLVICFLLFFCFDFFCYLIYFNKWVEKNKEINLPPPKFEYSIKLKPFEQDYINIRKNKLRKPVGITSNKKSIVIFGCSYAYGYILPDEKILSYKLYELTGRPIYNRAFVAWGLQHMLYQLKRDDFYKEIKEPEYIIYIFITDHLRRMYSFVSDSPFLYNELYLRYEIKNGKCRELNKEVFSYAGFSILKSLKEKRVNDTLYKKDNFNKVFDDMESIFVESKKEVQKHYPKTKFIILKYRDHNNSWYLNTDRWKELEREGFIVIDTKNLTGKDLYKKEYVFKEVYDLHPNEKGWDVVSKSLKERFNF